jgi:hypothetical protein
MSEAPKLYVYVCTECGREVRPHNDHRLGMNRIVYCDHGKKGPGTMKSSTWKRVEVVLAETAAIQPCDGCEEQKPGCVSVGEEVLCAGCLLARATAFGDEVKSLISSWREGAERATEPGEAAALEVCADELQQRFDPSGGGE